MSTMSKPSLLYYNINYILNTIQITKGKLTVKLRTCFKEFFDRIEHMF